MGRSAARVFGEPERPAWSRMILALATNVRCSVTIDRLAAGKFERASDRNWPPVSDSTQTHSPTVASRPTPRADPAFDVQVWCGRSARCSYLSHENATPRGPTYHENSHAHHT